MVQKKPKFFNQLWLSSHRSLGYTMIEVMTVASILAGVTLLAENKILRFKAKALQSQAQTNLSHIYTLEIAYRETNKTFVKMPLHGRSNGSFICKKNALGFELKPCPNKDIIYGYEVSAGEKTFVAKARSGSGKFNKIVADCNIIDTWKIDETETLLQFQDARVKCP